jgi:hypothetical protein
MNLTILLEALCVCNVKYQSSEKPTGPKTKASKFEVGPVKIENQEV